MLVERARGILADIEGLQEMQPDAAGLTLFVQNGSAAIPHIIRLLDGAGIRIGPVSVSPASLDEVFLRATGSRLEGAESSQTEEPS